MSQPEEVTQPAANPGDEQAGSVASSPALAASQAAPLLMGVKLPIRILLGRTQLRLQEIAQLGSGAVVELDCSPNDPVEILVNDRIIARGEVVVVGGNYGVRITKMATRSETPEADGQSSDLRNLSEQLR
jgi:flagellar motor switch protein FliN